MHGTDFHVRRTRTHWSNIYIDLKLNQRLRRWASIKTALDRCGVFFGFVCIPPRCIAAPRVLAYICSVCCNHDNYGLIISLYSGWENKCMPRQHGQVGVNLETYGIVPALNQRLGCWRNAWPHNLLKNVQLNGFQMSLFYPCHMFTDSTPSTLIQH